MRPVGRGGLRRLRSRSLDTATLLARLRRHPDVLFAEPNYVVHAMADPRRSAAAAALGAAERRAGCQRRRPWTRGCRHPCGIRVGRDVRIDLARGRRRRHRHRLHASRPRAQHLVGSCAVHRDHRRRRPHLPGRDARFQRDRLSCDPMDDHLHGTHVAGTIGAAGNNGDWRGRRELDGSASWASSSSTRRAPARSRTRSTASSSRSRRAMRSRPQAPRTCGSSRTAGAAVTCRSRCRTRSNRQPTRTCCSSPPPETTASATTSGPPIRRAIDVPNVIAVAATTNTDDRA